MIKVQMNKLNHYNKKNEHTAEVSLHVPYSGYITKIPEIGEQLVLYYDNHVPQIRTTTIKSLLKSGNDPEGNDKLVIDVSLAVTIKDGDWNQYEYIFATRNSVYGIKVLDENKEKN